MKILFACLTFLLFAGCFMNAQNRVERSRFDSVFDQKEMIKDNMSFHLLPSNGSSLYIDVYTQKDFDEIANNLQKALKGGAKDITIRISKGRFYFNENHISIRDTYHKDVSLHIIGNKTEVVSAGKLVTISDVKAGTFSPEAIYLDRRLNDVFFWSDMFQTDQMVEVVDFNSKYCRMHCSEIQLPSTIDCTNAYLQLTEWYMSGTYKIDKVDGEYVYFIASDLSKGMAPYGDYNVNYDYTVAKRYPRFRVCNLPVPSCNTTIDMVENGVGLYQCTSSCFLDFYGSDFKQVELAGLNFIGNCSGSKLINMHGARTSDGFFIKNCKFSAIKSIVVYILETPNVIVNNCLFEDCYNNVILGVANATRNTHITDNAFFNVGKGLQSTGAIRCQSENFYIARNTIVNYGMMGIGVGLGYRGDKEGYGIIEDNVLYFTDDYYKKASKNSIIDGGAIYLWTRNKGTIIRYNRIHNYIGAGANRGIYCDDGAYGFSIYGNVITNVGNSNYIDSRKVNFSYLPSNTNNLIVYNIISGNYKYVGSDNIAQNGCVKGANILLNKKGTAPEFAIVVDNIQNPEEDVCLPYKSIKGLSIVVPRSTRRELRKLPFYNRIKKYFKVGLS